MSINQANDACALRERADQVRLMGRIFGGAAAVVVYLGVDNDTVNEALHLLTLFSSISDNAWKLLDKYSKESTTPMVRFAANYDIPPFGADSWTVLAHLGSRPWFERVWCIQEFVNSQASGFLVGTTLLQSDKFLSMLIRAARWPSYAFAGLIDPKEDLDRRLAAEKMSVVAHCACRLLDRRQETQILALEKSYPTLADLLASTRRYKATDCRDKLYALLGMLNPDELRDIEIRYDESVNMLSARISRFLRAVGQIKVLLYQIAAYDKSPHDIDINRSRRCKK